MALILDNLPVHRSNAVKAGLRSTGLAWAFLPPYSPDLNGIELVWSQFKSTFRKLHLQEVAAGNVPDLAGLSSTSLASIQDD